VLGPNKPCLALVTRAKGLPLRVPNCKVKHLGMHYKYYTRMK